MATFQVGQRVRIKWSHALPELDGSEGTVVGAPQTGHDFITGHLYEGYPVKPDGWASQHDADGIPFCPTGEQLEPIQYDGNKAVEWSECLWQPKHETA
jgi:hypothetical protein